jgi:hypothetical protein
MIPIRKKNLSAIFLRVSFLIIFINDIRSKNSEATKEGFLSVDVE